MSGQLHAHATLPPGKSPSTHFIGGWVDPRVGVDDMEKWKFFTLSELELPLPLVIQPVASRYTDWANFIAIPEQFMSSVLPIKGMSEENLSVSDPTRHINISILSSRK
jgi:hypothetical protein